MLTVEMDRLEIKDVKFPSEILVPRNRVMNHIFNREQLPDQLRYAVIPSSQLPPIYPDGFYPANIGTLVDPLILELRFEPISMKVGQIDPTVSSFSEDDRVRIALLMTQERSAKDLELLGRTMYERVKDISFDVVIGPESLGSKLALEIARAANVDGREVFPTSLQKGKMNGSHIGPPKEWITEEYGIEVSSGTSSNGVKQKLYLDPRYANLIKDMHWNVLLADDARLTMGTITASLELFKKLGISVTGITTVLNEGSPIHSIANTEGKEIPFRWLTKLPLSHLVSGGIQPIPGTFNGLEYFLVRK